MERPSTSRFAVSSLVLLAAIAWSASGCKLPGRQAGPRENITFAHTTSLNAALVHIAFAKGYFAEEGLDATPQPHSLGKLALDSVIGGKADFAATGDTPFVFAVMNGRMITAIAVIQTSNKNEAVVARRDRGIAKPSDLPGKRIGFTPGTTSDFFAHSFLLFRGIDEKQVRRVGMNPGEMAEALATGFTETDRTVPEDTWDDFTFRVVLDQGFLVNIEDQTRWVVKSRVTARTDMPKYLEFIYDDGPRSVKPGAVRVVK